MKHLISSLLERGWAEIRGVLTPEEILAVQRTLLDSSAEDRTQYGTAKDPRVTLAMFDNAETRRILLRIPNDPRMRQVLSAFQEHPFIEHTKMLVKGAHSAETPWHQDASFWRKFDPNESMLTLWVTLDEANELNGCLRLLDRSHRTPLLDHETMEGQELCIPAATMEGLLQSHPAVSAPLGAGDGLLFLSKLVHGAHPNRTNERRNAFKLVFQDYAKRNTAVARHVSAIDLEGVRGGLNRLSPLAYARARRWLAGNVSRKLLHLT